jgi:hypothetical protein
MRQYINYDFILKSQPKNLLKQMEWLLGVMTCPLLEFILHYIVLYDTVSNRIEVIKE